MAINSTKDDEELKESIKADVVKRLLKYLIEYKGQIVIVISLILITVAIGIAYPLLIERLIDVEIVNKDKRGLLCVVGIMLLLLIINLIADRIWRRKMAYLSNDIVLKIRRQLYEHIQELGVDFFDSRPAGKILARVTGDVNSLKDVYSSAITQFVPELLTVVVVVIVMLVVSPLLTLSAVVAIPVITFGVFMCEIVAHKRWQDMRKKESNLTAFIHESIAGATVIQSFNAEEEANREFSDIVDAHRDSFARAVRVADIFSPTIEISYGLGSLVLYYLAIKVLNVQADSVGTVSAFALYLGMFFGPIRNLANFYNKLLTNISAAERIFEILDIEPMIVDSEDAIELPTIRGNVIFDHVKFAYPDEPDVDILENVSFTVKSGETIALVGPTGAGKTTIISLISRFYDTKEGRVLIDGYDISKVKVHSLRSQLGIMTQDNYLFSGTIRENIAYGTPDASMEDIERAAKAVHAHDFIMQMTDGYTTTITERGGGLSIGQRQLIAFARTLLTDPKILILDEATSSIDTQSEIMVQRGIEEMLKDRTSFVVAHRLSTIRNADRIFVIDKGGIIEQGNHDTLMDLGGAYYRLYQSQFVGVE